LLNYFDQQDARQCGICDVCIDNKKRDLKEDTSALIINELVEVLSGSKLTLDVLINKVHNGTEKEKIAVLRELLDAGKIKSDGVIYYI
jgi:ATP-dependent DNA helicase RecQ